MSKGFFRWYYNLIDDSFLNSESGFWIIFISHLLASSATMLYFGYWGLDAGGWAIIGAYLVFLEWCFVENIVVEKPRSVGGILAQKGFALLVAFHFTLIYVSVPLVFYRWLRPVNWAEVLPKVVAAMKWPVIIVGCIMLFVAANILLAKVIGRKR